MKKLLVLTLLLLASGAVPLAAQADPTAIAGDSNASYGTSTFPTPAAQPQPSINSGFTALAPIPGLTDQSPTSLVNSANLVVFFNNLYKYLIGAAAILAIVMIMWGGVEIATQDAVPAKQDGKKKIWNALFGLALVLSPAIVFSIIDPTILNLSLSLDKLDIPNATQPSTTTLQPGQQVACSSSLFIGQSSNTSDTTCVQKLQQQCKDAGGIPKLTGTTVITVECTAKPNIPPVGTAITVDQCIGQLTNGNGNPIVASGQSCATAPANLKNGKNCRDLVGGGFCIW